MRPDPFAELCRNRHVRSGAMRLCIRLWRHQLANWSHARNMIRH